MSKNQRLGAPDEEVICRFLSSESWNRFCDELSLSNREIEICQQFLHCANEVEIAETLRISRHTVHSHTHRLYRKLKVHSRQEVVAKIFCHYLDCS